MILDKKKIWQVQDTPIDCLVDVSTKSLFDKYAKDDYEYSHEWFLNLAQNGLSANERNVCVVAKSNVGDHGILVLRYNEGRRNLYSLTTYYSSLYRVIVEGDNERETLLQLFTYALNKYRTTSIMLSPMDVNSTQYRNICHALKQCDVRPHQFFCFINWYLPVQGRDYATYLSTLSSRVRNTIKRRGKKYQSLSGSRLDIVMNDESLEEAIIAYTMVYQKSWKKPEPFPQFIPELIRQASKKGVLRLGIAWAGERPIAAQIWLVNNKRATIYKLAYDEAYKKHSIGTILTAHLMKYVIDEDKVTEVDYLTGNDHYKKDWMSHQRERWGVIAYNPRTFIGFFCMLNLTIKKVIKRIVQLFLRNH